MSKALALGFSGGGDSTALLHALRFAYPDHRLYAFIVDHGLRPESATEAEQSLHYAQELGAIPHILRWTTPHKGQDAARQARHRLLAKACAEKDVELLCLAHTLDDRIETLRMRAMRKGRWRTLTGMRVFDASPVWPDGACLTVVRPFLNVRRNALRMWLKDIKAHWIEDPSNIDPAYERVRVRQRAYKEDSTAETGLLSLSDQSLSAEALLRKSALRLIERHVQIMPWGGAVFRVEGFGKTAEPVAFRAMEAVILALSGRSTSPARKNVMAMINALQSGQPASGAGVHLTKTAIMGRDPGAMTGRADGGLVAKTLQLEPGQRGVFDGRWLIRADRKMDVKALSSAPYSIDETVQSVPAVFRPGLTALAAPGTGEIFAILGINCSDGDNWTLLCNHRIQRWLLPPEPPSWFDVGKPAELTGAALAKPV